MRRIISVSFLLMLLPSAVYAQASTSMDTGGNIQFMFDGNPSVKMAPAGVGPTGAPCPAVSEGAIRYNRTTKTFEGCNGATWGGLGSSSTPDIQHVVGPQVCRSYSVATCPAGYTMISGGHIWSGDCACDEKYRFTVQSHPEGNGWGVFMECSVYSSVAICARF